MTQARETQNTAEVLERVEAWVRANNANGATLDGSRACKMGFRLAKAEVAAILGLPTEAVYEYSEEALS